MFLLFRLAAFVGLWFYSRRQANRRLSQDIGISKLSWPQRIQLIWRLSRDPRLPLALRAAVWLPAIYLVSPIDLIPDFIPVLGRLDDAVIYSLATDMLIRFAPAAILEEYLQGLRPRR